jgi:REP element-mobilizing transposase RayT
VEGEPAVYHCISRVVAGERLLDDGAKEVLRKMLWKTAAFCGVEVLAYCILSNHFHILVRVLPPVGGSILDRAEILRRYRAFYGELPGSPNFPTAQVLAAKFKEGGDEADRWETRLRARMGDISEFMKTLKQRFSIWFNKTHRRFGTLWAERFKSVLVEDSAFAMKTVAAYIDLNPVRAGLVDDPVNYRWCSYAEAMAGNRALREGYAKVLGSGLENDDWRGDLASYRMVLFGKGGQVRRDGQSAISEQRVKQVLQSGGKLESHEILRAGVRHFTEGAILGSREFVQRFSRGGVALLEMPSAVISRPKNKLRTQSITAIPLKEANSGLDEAELVTLRRPRKRRMD